jgi:hypothetical protein
MSRTPLRRAEFAADVLFLLWLGPDKASPPRLGSVLNLVR